MSRPHRIVADTNVLVSAFLSSGPPRAIVQLCRRGHATLFLSHAIIAELEGVLRKKLGWTGAQVLLAVEELRSFAVVVVPVEDVDVVVEDPADNRILECALECSADYIVSGDTRHLQPLKSVRHIPIMSPVQFLERHEK